MCGTGATLSHSVWWKFFFFCIIAFEWKLSGCGAVVAVAACMFGPAALWLMTLDVNKAHNFQFSFCYNFVISDHPTSFVLGYPLCVWILCWILIFFFFSFWGLGHFVLILFFLIVVSVFCFRSLHRGHRHQQQNLLILHLYVQLQEIKRSLQKILATRKLWDNL